MSQYIDKDAVVAEIKERIDRDNEKAASYPDNSETDYLYRVKEAVYKDLLSFLNTLEVKEVDLEKEISFQWSKFCLNGKDKDSFIKVVKHFFELGLNVKKRK
jgi:hypothetical protein